MKADKSAGTSSHCSSLHEVHVPALPNHDDPGAERGRERGGREGERGGGRERERERDFRPITTDSLSGNETSIVRSGKSSN